MSDDSKLLQFVGEKLRYYRTEKNISQEDFAFECGLDRTYISDIERAKRNLSLLNIQRITTALGISLSDFFSEDYNSTEFDVQACEKTYLVNDSFSTDRGFIVNSDHVNNAAVTTTARLAELPFPLFQSIDLKALSGIVGALFATEIAKESGSIVNPIEKGHPDVIPKAGINASEEKLRNYGQGLEIKCTVGNVAKGSDLSSGDSRLPSLKGVTWQAHHREVSHLMGLIIDFAGKKQGDANYPMITGVFNADNLEVNDWGAISGTSGRNTKVTGMTSSGKSKMGGWWVLLKDDEDYIDRYTQILKFKTE